MKAIETSQGISKNTIIAEMLESYPEKAVALSEKLMEFGVHCVGCGASTFETLEQGVLGHGYSEEELDVLVEELNKIIREKNTSQKKSLKSFQLKLTDKALQKVKQVMEQEKKEGATLRISVLAGGCSGHTYDMEIVDKPLGNDLNFKQGTVNIAVDKNSLDYLHGTTVDFVDTLNESGFKFNNPNAHKSCGCGKSFR
jgi:iron-sulfur cluster assembly accessory protein